MADKCCERDFNSDGNCDRHPAGPSDHMTTYARACTGYYDGKGQGGMTLRRDLEREHGMMGHPKADLLYSIAWEEGHSAGYAEVALQYGKLVEPAR